MILKSVLSEIFKSPIKTNKIFNINQNFNDIVRYYIKATLNIIERFYGGFIAPILI